MDDGLKQRLVGAVVLTSVAVLFLPVVFEREVRLPVDTATRITPPPQVQPLPIQSPVRPKDIIAAKDPEQMYQPDTDAPVDDTPEPAGLNAEGVPRAWVVQVASYNNETHAKQLSEQLLKVGYKAYYRRAKTAKGPMVRVFVGPKIDKQSAWKIKRELDKTLHVESLVLQFQP